MSSQPFKPGYTHGVRKGEDLNAGVAGNIELLASAQSSPSNPTGTTSTSAAVMMGLAGAFTPGLTGSVLIMLSGDIFNAGAIADGATVQLSYGSGSAPSNAGTLTGTQVGGKVHYVASTTAGKVPFCVQAVITGLTVDTAYWLDAAVESVTGGTATIENLSLSAIEIG